MDSYFLMHLSAVAAGLASVSTLVRYAVKHPSSRAFGVAVQRLPTPTRHIALTFDDGPSESTHSVLEILAEFKVSATFFVCGMNVERLPAIAQSIVDAGHEIGNHTYSHMRLCPRVGFRMKFRTPQSIYLELQKTQELIAAELGVVPKLFRAPYGLRWVGLSKAQRSLGLTGVLWTVIGHDWEWPAERIAAHVLESAQGGSIICLHDGRDVRPSPNISEMLKALRIILQALHQREFQFCTLSEGLALGHAA